MNSLPEIPIFSHSKKILLPMQKLEISIQTVPNHQIDCDLPYLKKKDSVEFDKKSRRKNSNMLEWMMLKRKESSIFFAVLRNVFLPQFFAFLFTCLLMQVENYLNLKCYEADSNFSYFIIRNALFNNAFYNFGVGLCFFFEEKSQKFMNIIMYGGVLGIIFIIHYKGKYLISIGNLKLDAILFSVLFQVIYYVVIKAYQRSFRKVELLRIFFIIIFFFIMFVDHYIIRQYLIKLVYVKLQDSPNHNIIFQFFLFLFYQIHGKIFLSILNKFRSKIPKNLFLIAIKYYIINVLFSCTILSIMYTETKYMQIFAIFNFSSQMISLYVQSNIFWHYFCYLLNFLKRNHDNKYSKNTNSEIKSIIAGLTNESIYAITFTILKVIIFNRTFNFTIYEYGPKNFKKFCVTSFDNLVSFIPQNIFLLFAINFFYFLYLIMKMKDDGKVRFLWKTEEFTLLIRIYSIVLIQGIADINFQFYLHLQLLKQ